MTSDEITRELLVRADRERRNDRRLLWIQRLFLALALVAAVVLAFKAYAQDSQHGINWRDGCGRIWSTWLEEGSKQADLPLPPRLTPEECRTGERQ